MGQRRGNTETRGCYRVEGEGGEERQKLLRVGHFPGENEKSEGVALLAGPRTRRKAVVVPYSPVSTSVSFPTPPRLSLLPL